ncbi:MAG: type II secretion system protein [Microcystis aeruginosa L211-07]|nr:type II secretion system protein [Microcystis aeruginosa L211-07]
MRFYLGYINHLVSLQKKSARLVRQAGFTITEVLLASAMMVIVISVAGDALINLLRSNYRANAGTEIQNNLNRTLEFVSDEVRRAKTIADSEAAITSTQVPTGARAVLAFQIPNPDNPSQLLPDQIVYYTENSRTGDSLTGPRVLWRYGPNLDEDGNYDITSSWQHSPVTDRLADATNNQGRYNCDPFQTDIEIPTGWKRIPAVRGEVEGFYVCVRNGGGQVILNANAEVEMTTVTNENRDKVKYSVSTRVSPRATD